MKVKQRAKRAVVGVLKSVEVHRRLLLAATAGIRGVGGEAHILVCPPGAGNLGDQALVEAFLENIAGPVVLITRSATDFVIEARFADRVRVVAVPSLLYGRLPDNVGAARRFAELLRGARSVSIVGADTMDGAYNHRAAVNRAAVAEVSARRGIPTRVLGFSWNGAPHPAAVRQLGLAAASGARLYLRDPRSEARAVRDGLTNVAPSADIVFSATSVDDTLARKWLASFSEPGRPIAIVNVSGLIREEVDLAAEYVSVVRHLAADCNVLLLPHVVKVDSDDAEACREVMRLIEPGLPVQLVTDAPSPAQVRGFCRHAASIVTGRMHLAVNGLLQGRMPIVLATQGKVEGLMELFDAPQLCIAPGRGMADAIIRQIGWARAHSSEPWLDRVKELSAQNFLGLTQPAPMST
ncbi:colanic acid/amylovoran biosynthesis protein [Agrococcus sp. UYP10]|uniref:polysaccharide pyruvyl transferase family protein n=1 Tax=Agrococcus sp. UYP10 TaxID=1756355 RepID=UPI0033931423